uniref:Globin domain-containing protein n=1 Tax=Amphora coffeiformis TaxID=265554 RepID=A0A7S3P9L4_9STRA|mmetsp:Transcript_3929/g.7824  ORF Transcript_3929/g.7824 Transcript_3929/m.7824 type:complete len:150 (-) Transcript_3929:193-642(-)
MSLVVQTWNEVKKIPQHQEVAGKLLFQKIFDIEPETKEVFSFGTDYINGREDEIFEDPRFKKHARTVIAMVDTAIQLLEAGDTKTLFSALHQLGARHASYKVEQHHYPIVGQALILTLEAALGDAFTVEVKKQWVATASQIFNAMVTSW